MNPWVLIGFVVVLATTNASSFLFGKHVEAGENAQAELDSERLTAALIKAKQHKVDVLALKHAQIRTVQVVKDRIITKEVTRYVEVTPAADRCTLPGTWRLRHDAAATGEPTEPASVVAGAADPVEDAAAIGVVAENYANCRDAIEQVKGWQEYWEAVK